MTTSATMSTSTSTTTLRIAEVATRTGVPATTLRYYEDIGLLAPARRKGNGYRAYTERDVERLRFITRAKQLEISLDELHDLVLAWDGEDCAGVQERLARVVAARLVQTRDRVVDLLELAAQLQAAAARLGEPATPGPCDDGCACATATTATVPSAAAIVRGPAPVELTRSAPVETGPPIACSLDGELMRGRLTDWQAVLQRASAREPIDGGVALTFAADVELTVELARLAAAEQACCAFFDFTLAVTGTGVRFEVRAPAEAQDILAALLGPPGPSSPSTHDLEERS
jgi:DNA-binding transcriptional MerR regulator